MLDAMVTSLAPPALLLLDVNETLSDTGALAGVLEGLRAPGHLGATWFASVLRDGFALTAAGHPAPFSDVARAAARSLLAPHVPPGSLDDAAETLVGAVGSLPLHPDVPDGLAALATTGIRVVALTNGSASVASGLLERGGVRQHLEAVLSVEAFGEGAWKPAASAYRGACATLGVETDEAVLVAVHRWDVDGAAGAGLRTVLVDRTGGGRQDLAVFREPGRTVSGLDDLASQMIAH